MIRSLYTAATAMYAQQLNMDTISSNLSNVNTTGFKKSRPVFQDLLYSKLAVADVGNAQSTLELGTGTRVIANRRDFSDGGLAGTGQPLDVALQGRGFLAVRLPSGAIGYTRNGALHLTNGKLVNSSGYAVLSSTGSEITASGQVEVSINDAGAVVATAIDGKKTTLAHLGIGIPVNPQAMSAAGDSVFTSTETITLGASGEGGRASIAPGFLENANVQVVEEMINLITAQRAYEVGSKAIQASDEMLQQANNLRR